MYPPVRLFLCLSCKASSPLLLAMAATAMLATTAMAQSQNGSDGWKSKNGPATTTPSAQGQSKPVSSPYRPARFRTASRSFSRPWTTKLNGVAPSIRVAAGRQPSLATPPDETLEEIVAEPSIEVYEEGDPYLEESGEFADCWNLCGWRWWENLTVFGGVSSFKGPVDQGVNGNNGANVGLNFSLPLSYYYGIGLQVGANFVESDFSGFDNQLNASDRSQTFFTVGVFHRVESGWQYGVVGDFLQDRYYVDMDIAQIRGELSWVNGCGGEWGVRVTGSSQDDVNIENPNTAPVTNLWQPTEQFVAFYRRQLQNGGEGQIWAGGTGENDGLIGGDITVPISSSFAINAAANYLIPEEGSGTGGNVGESWGMIINLVWYPGGRAYGETSNPYRPLFRVADNTSFLVDRLTP